jgi:shikimate dehydrogenase
MSDGHTQLVGLIGWPVEHSLSPAMHNAAFDALGLNWRYVPLPVPPGQVKTAVRGLAALGFRGANVTVPHKQAVMPVLDSIVPNARALGAVNTLVIGRRADGTSTIGGYNTDDKGFVGALRQGGFEPEDGGNIVVVGAGGAARAVVFGLLWSGLGEIVVLNRTLERAQALISDLSYHPPFAARLRALPLTPETLVESARAADLLVNATTLGMWPHVEGSIWPADVPLPAHLTVFDLVYNPLETRLLRQARESGARAVDGLGMLVRQGAIAFEMWTGEGPVDEIAILMRTACERVLERQPRE